MFSHIHVGVSDLSRALAFYRSVLGEIGLETKFVDFDRGWFGFRQPGCDRPLFLVGRPYDGRDPSPGNGHMVALRAPTRAVVDRAYAAALASGGSDEGGPGLRPWYHADYYGAYLRDPDGNKLCICCHEPDGPPASE
ncbi:VOC family protein [Chthonobacter albigriseus]|uniref:VOC family protein n=1 Tax=Chthonobacter albigriseus TaxID=1683161 RepID=UPI0015EF7458|nr:VOC family protein [Chthonobacter albigriseus]